MNNVQRTLPQKVWRSSKGHFIAGLVVVVPLAITYVVLSWLYHLVDGILEPFVSKALGWSFPGIGIMVLFLLVYLLGVATTFLPARRTIEGMLSLLLRTPVIKDIYGISARVVDTMVRVDEKGGFKRVVMVDYPRPGTKSLGFVTGQIVNSAGKQWEVVFIPATPNPTMGNMIIVDAAEVKELDISIESALKMVISAGTMTAKGLKMEGHEGVGTTT